MSPKQPKVQPHSEELVYSLIDTAIEVNGDFCVGMSKAISRNRRILLASDIIEKLSDSYWHIMFANGRQEYVGFRTAMIFLFLVDGIRQEIRKYQQKMKEGDCAAALKINIDLHESEIMQPMVVRKLIVGLMK